MSASAKPLRVVLCWHMHQPEYRDPGTGTYQFPWTYLHGIKDYVDMVAHLEAHPQARAVVNFAPILLEQIEDYVRQIDICLKQGVPINDPVLNLLANDQWPEANSDDFRQLMSQCLRANNDRIIKRFPEYAQLADYAHWLLKNDGALIYLAPQFLIDLSVWYHLGWMAETVRRDDDRIKRLQSKGRDFDRDDRLTLLRLIDELLKSIAPRYRRLADSGRVELSFSPHSHPIIPLLLDVHAAQEAIPGASLPAGGGYPGGEERAHWHMREGARSFERFFGIHPRGCWLSEGGVSQASLRLLDQHHVAWTASGESVLRNSMNAAAKGQEGAANAVNHFRAYRFDDATVRCFFRDDGLSDLIGFTYADWHAEDAVADLVRHLEQIAANCTDPGHRVVSIIMDGENAWEHYPENGYYFLSHLYEALVRHPKLTLSTYSDILADGDIEPVAYPRLVAGSWVYGTFSTWIGSADKNRGWDLLIEAKKAYDEVLASGTLAPEVVEAATRQLAVCEGSDWFWWFGDYNAADAVSDFERLYRRHLTRLYELIGRPAPESLTHVISQGRGTPARGGTMRHGQSDGGGGP
ncbi:glycoside hydrolase family 57 protein [Mangrovitalea sediminis]|uniref:glycoside hydrolase family 57 protein n=1 Tax=Mangrovitalea sediminis TaxID=1982043 RepID=UPI000BE5EA7D|nr:glycoside hydrolase family 57 protein [Mangrovitalea sediminis]